MGAPQAEIVAWALLPLVFALTCLGAGWLVGTLLRIELRGPLVLPVGFCASIVAVMPGYLVGADNRVAATILVVATVAGFVTRRADLKGAAKDALGGPWLLAAVAVLACYIAPVVLSGSWSWTGYNFVNDTAVQYLLTDWLAGHGIPFHSQPSDTTLAVTQQYLVTSYPLGVHAHLATLQALLGTPVPVLYQTYLGLLMAMAALACYRIAARAGLRPVAATAAGVFAPIAALTYQYGLQGNVKELGAIAAIITSAAVARELVDGRDQTRWALCLALCLAALLEVYAAAGIPYALALAGCALVAVLVGGDRALRRRLLPTAGVAAVGLLVFSIPALASISTSLRVLNAGFGSASIAPPLGQLVRQLPLEQAGGIWLAGDYRFPLIAGPARLGTALGLVLVGLLVLAGITWLVRRRETGPLILLGALALTYALVAPRTSPYADGKMLAILSPGIVLVAVVGAWALSRRVRVPAVLAMGAVGTLVLASCAVAYHDTRLAPTKRMIDMADVGDRFAGRHLALFNEYEEFAKYFARRMDINVPTEAVTPKQIKLRGGDGYVYTTYDLDEQLLAYVEEFGEIVVRRGPATSRPPANYRLAYENGSYAVWQRVPGTTVLDHLSLGSPAGRAGTPVCEEVRKLASAARPGEMLVAAAAPDYVTWDLLKAPSRPFAWPPDPERPGQVYMSTPGKMGGTITLPSAGRYVAWVKGSFGRAVEVRVDGRSAGKVEGINTPGGWLSGDSLELSAGRHTIEFERGGGTLRPGDGARASGGPVALMQEGEGRLVRVEPRDAGELCGKRWDWIERVSGSPPTS